jgi:hypothetical protein
MFNSKRSLMEAVLSSKDIVNSMNDDQADENGYLTYVTTIGWVTGKTFELNPIDATAEDKIAEEIQKLYADGKKLDSLSLGVSMFNAWIKEEEEKTGKEVTNSSNAIFLEDTKIVSHNGKTVNTNVFVLFSDQVVGVIPGKISL